MTTVVTVRGLHYGQPDRMAEVLHGLPAAADRLVALDYPAAITTRSITVGAQRLADPASPEWVAQWAGNWDTAADITAAEVEAGDGD